MVLYLTSASCPGLQELALRFGFCMALTLVCLFLIALAALSMVTALAWTAGKRLSSWALALDRSWNVDR